MSETWLPIKGYEELYMISSHGNVYSFHRNRLLKPKATRTGYLRVTLCNEISQKTVMIHRLVAEAFIPNPRRKPTVNHLNEVKTDNRIENLEWATNAEQNTYGTRLARARANTDYRARNINYKDIASKHDYSREDMCGRKAVLVFEGDALVGRFPSIRELSVHLGRGYTRLSTSIKQGKPIGKYTVKYEVCNL